MKKQTGQSLIEFILILPIFFIALSGFIFIFQQQMRVFTDEGVESALALSEANFENGERMTAKWHTVSEPSQEKLLKQIAQNAFEPSAFFKGSTDLIEGVFADKKKIKPRQHLNNHTDECSQDALYEALVRGNGTFELKTCAPENAYERVSSQFVKKFELGPQIFHGRSLFYPQLDFSWPKRSFALTSAIKDYFAFAASFQLTHASLFVPENAQFNKKCFLEPFQPQCDLILMEEKFARAAKFSAKAQLVLCVAEAAIPCGSSTFGAPVCVAAKIALIAAAVSAGNEASQCSRTNKMLKIVQKKSQIYFNAVASKIFAEEVALRAQILR
jgi:hypothetical protein